MKKTLTSTLFIIATIMVLIGALMKFNYNKWGATILLAGLFTGIAAHILSDYYKRGRIKELEKENQELKEQIKS